MRGGLLSVGTTASGLESRNLFLDRSPPSGLFSGLFLNFPREIFGLLPLTGPNSGAEQEFKVQQIAAVFESADFSFLFVQRGPLQELICSSNKKVLLPGDTWALCSQLTSYTEIETILLLSHTVAVDVNNWFAGYVISYLLSSGLFVGWACLMSDFTGFPV